MSSEVAREVAAKRKNPGRKRFAEEEAIKAALRKAIPEADVLAALAVACKKREPGAIALYLGYLWGKPVERMVLGGEGGGPIEHKNVGFDYAGFAAAFAGCLGIAGSGDASPDGVGESLDTPHADAEAGGLPGAANP